jgi:RNA polymerase sigma factor, sigma-70 family
MARTSKGAAPAERPDETTRELMLRFRKGDTAALERIFTRYTPRLRRWAHGRLPAGVRGQVDTEDLVQEAFIKTLRRLAEFEPKRDGGFRVFVRKALQSRIIDEVRRLRRQPAPEELPSGLADPHASPLEEAIAHEAVDSYEAALARLSESDRAAIIARVEEGMEFADVARALGKTSADAARMAVARALVRLAREMGRD